MSPIKSDLNLKAVRQKAERTISEIVEHGKTPLLVIAGPGTGKSTTLAQRVAHLIKKGIPPEKIHLLSFTNASTADLKEKLEKQTDQATRVSLSTVHGVANRILRENCESGYFVSSDADDLLILQDAYPTLSYNGRKEFLDRENKKYANLRSASKDEKYSLLKRYYRSLNFYEITAGAVAVLQNPTILAAYQKEIEHLIVDEYQDLNRADQKLIGLLAGGKSAGITICGDDDQSIYGFRFAAPEGIIELHKSGKFLNKTLEFCFRSPKCIIEAALPVINEITRLGKARIPKNLYAEDTGETIEIISLPSVTRLRNKEAEWVLGKIKETLSSSPGVEKILVMASEPAIMKELKQMLKDEKIPFLSKREKLLGEKGAKELYYGLRLIRDRNDNMATRWVVELTQEKGNLSDFVNSMMKAKVPLQQGILDSEEKAGISKVTIDKLGRLLAISGDLGPSEMVKAVGAVFNISPELLAFKKFIELAEDSKDLRELLNKVEREILDIESCGSEDEGKALIEIITMHSSKGLSCDVAFIMGAEETFIPKETTPTADEVRLFYVALTRSRKLFISFVRSRQTKAARGNYIRKRSSFVDSILSRVEGKHFKEVKIG